MNTSREVPVRSRAVLRSLGALRGHLHRAAAAALGCGVVVTLAASGIRAIPLRPGDIIVNDVGSDSVVRVDPDTGDRAIVTGCTLASACGTSVGTGSGPNFNVPSGIAIAPDGSLVVTDSTLGALFRVDPATGARTIIGETGDGLGESLTTPQAVAALGDGSLFVADSERDRIFRVDPTTLHRSTVSGGTRGSGPALVNPARITLESDGYALVSDAGAEAVFRVDLASGDREVVTSNSMASGPFLRLPAGLGLEADGSILLADLDSDRILRIDPDTGDRTVVSGCVDISCSALVGAGVVARSPRDLAVESDGSIVVALMSPAVLRIDPVTGDRAILTSTVVGEGPNLASSLNGVAIVPIPEPSSGALLVSGLVALRARAARRRKDAARTAGAGTGSATGWACSWSAVRILSSLPSLNAGYHQTS